MKKSSFDVFFIICATIILVVMNEYGLLEKYIAFSLIPILIAYYLGQFAQKKFGINSKDK